MTDSKTSTFDQFAILELMGHRRLGGRVREETIGGAPFLRLDVPPVGELRGFTQFYSAAAIYCITPTSEAVARAIAAQARHEPVSHYEVPQVSGLLSGSLGADGDEELEEEEGA